MNAGVLFVNARVHALDGEAAPHTALAVRDGRVLALGHEADLTPLQDQGLTRRDMGGAVILPGFMDCHSHMLLTGMVAQGLNLAAARSVDDACALVAGACTGLPPESWLRGFLLEDRNLAEGRMPEARELDRVAPGRPVVLFHPTLHRCSLSSAALRALGLLENPRAVPGLDLQGDTPTGVVRDPGILTRVFPGVLQAMARTELEDAALTAARQALAAGVTLVQSMEGGELTPGCSGLLLACAPRLPLPVICWNQSMDLAEVQTLGLPRVGGCICADGELDARTAALFEPYCDDPGNDGTLLYSQRTMDDFVLAAHGRGLQVAVHCESDRAIEQVLRAVERAQRAVPRADARHRIEHFELPTRNQIDRMAAAGVVASMQPAFLSEFIAGPRLPHMVELFGPHRVRRLHPYRTILDAGVRVCGGSDSPVTPYAPLRGMADAMRHPIPGQSVTAPEALAMFTTEAAHSVFAEAERGRLRPGMRADLTVLGADPLAASPDEVERIAVLETWVAGRRAHATPGAPPLP
jgi:hypothetical protein